MSKPFTKHWWDFFVDSTQNLSEPKVFKSTLSAEMATLSKMTLDLLSVIAISPVTEKTRIWCDGNRVDSKSVNAFLSNPNSFSTIEEWYEATYEGRKKVGIIINNCQNYSEPLKSFVFCKVKPLLKLRGMPSEGNDITLFAGDYDYSPIGFHLDPSGHRTVHFQIGPGTKEMYLIPEHKYENDQRPVTRTRSKAQKLKKLMSEATRFDIEPGDLFYMPPGYYHVGKNRGFSSSISFWYQDTLIHEITEQIALALARKIFSTKDSGIFPSDSSPIKSSKFQFAQFEKTFSNSQWTLSRTAKRLINDCLQERKLMLYSNNFFELTTKHTSNSNPKELSESDTIKGNAYYRIYCTNCPSFTSLFVQGERINVRPNKGLAKAVRIINGGRKIRVGVLIDILKTSWSEFECFTFVKELAKRGAILLQDNSLSNEAGY